MFRVGVCLVEGLFLLVWNVFWSSLCVWAVFCFGAGVYVEAGVCVWSGMLFSVRISVGLGVCNWAGGCVGARACICTGVCFWD